MLKLYKFTDSLTEYWEAWDNNDASFTVHWGILGTRGKDKIVNSGFFQPAKKRVAKEALVKKSQGFKALDTSVRLLIEFQVEGHGKADDIEKRYRLHERMDETIGCTGLGYCDGGSIGNGTMEVCCFVIDFEIAKKTIEDDLMDTEFANYSRIYLED